MRDVLMIVVGIAVTLVGLGALVQIAAWLKIRQSD